MCSIHRPLTVTMPSLPRKPSKFRRASSVSDEKGNAGNQNISEQDRSSPGGSEQNREPLIPPLHPHDQLLTGCSWNGLF